MANENDKITQQPDPVAGAQPDPAKVEDGKKDKKTSSSKSKADLEKENAELLAKLKALETTAANAAKNGEASVAATVKEDDREEIFVPKGYANDEPFLIVGVNGINYQLPKGKPSTVPKFVADEFRRSQKAQAALDDRIEKMTSVS